MSEATKKTPDSHSRRISSLNSLTPPSRVGSANTAGGAIDSTLSKKSKKSGSRTSAITAIENSDSIHVVCRFRPTRTTDSTPGIDIDRNSNSVSLPGSYDRKTFAFDKVSQYTPSSSSFY